MLTLDGFGRLGRRGTSIVIVGQPEHEQERPGSGGRTGHRHHSREERRESDQHEPVQERRDQYATGPERADCDQERGEIPRAVQKRPSEPPRHERQDERELDQVETEIVGRP
jgi:hypothetical protein